MSDVVGSAHPTCCVLEAMLLSWQAPDLVK